MKKYFDLFIICIMAIACTSCRSLTSETLAGEWNVTELEGKTIEPSEETPFLGFDVSQEHIYGFTGCNRLTGYLDVKAFLSGTPQLDKIGATRMLCADDSYERSFLAAMGKVTRQRYAHGSIELQDNAGNVLIRLKKRK